jgi:hypothetical protein
MKNLLPLVVKYKYIVIALAAGLVILMLPSRSSTIMARDAPLTDEAKLELILSELDGAGGVSVALSKNGVIVVCPNMTPDIRLKLTSAVSVYTGLSYEKIIILKKEPGK